MGTRGHPKNPTMTHILSQSTTSNLFPWKPILTLSTHIYLISKIVSFFKLSRLKFVTIYHFSHGSCKFWTYKKVVSFHICFILHKITYIFFNFQLKLFKKKHILNNIFVRARQHVVAQSQLPTHVLFIFPIIVTPVPSGNQEHEVVQLQHKTIVHQETLSELSITVL